MMRPGTNVKSPAITSAPEKMPIIVKRWRRTRVPNADRHRGQREDREQMDRAPGAQTRKSWIQNELMATNSIRPAQV